MVSAPGAAAGGTSMNVSVVVCPATMVPFAVLPEVEVAPLTLCSVNPLGTFSVTLTVPGGSPVPNGGNEAVASTQSGPVVLAGIVMLGMVGPPGSELKVKTPSAVVAVVSCLQTCSVPWSGVAVATVLVGVAVVVVVAVRVAVAV